MECGLDVLKNLVRLNTESALRMPLRRVPLRFRSLARGAGMDEDPRTATREQLGSDLLQTCSPLSLVSAQVRRPSVANPVIFPPGRARLATNPIPTGSLSFVMTIGIVAVASFAGPVAERTIGDDDIGL